MKKTYWLILFTLFLAAELTAIQLGNQLIQYICKPLLVPMLAGYFFSHVQSISSSLIKWIFLALFFSWAGDVFLLFQDQKSLFFLCGLSAFLIAHILYIIFFHSIRVKESIKGNPWLLVLVVLYYALLIYILSPHLGTMKIPVRVYGIIISFMFMLAMHMLFLKNKAAGQRMFAGAFLFIISDSLLAINKFYSVFEGAGLLIMLTYALAQFFIVDGAARYIQSRNSQ